MPNIKLAGENSIIIYFDSKISEKLTAEISFFCQQLNAQLNKFIINLTPSYTSIHITYNLSLINYKEFVEVTNKCLQNHQYKSRTNKTKIITLPVYYATDVGFDLQNLLTKKHLTMGEFIKIHSAKTYLVYAIGFSPAFAFLGELDKRIQMPRLKTPRTQIPAGSVGIADNQTAIYPTNSPAGCNIIGRTPIDLSLNNPKNINKFKVGNRVKFSAIDAAEFVSLGGKL